MPPYLSLLCFLIFGSWAAKSPPVYRNYIASASEKIQLLELDGKLISKLYFYTTKIQKRIDILKRMANKFREPLKEAKGREEEYVSNPLNSVKILRCMRGDWLYAHNQLLEPVGEGDVEFVKTFRKHLPMHEDVEDAADGLYRIQQTFQLKTTDMAMGLLHGVQHKVSLSGLDCYAFGVEYFKAQYYKEAVEWIGLALKHLAPYTKEFKILGFDRSHAFKLYARALLEIEEESLLTLKATELIDLYKQRIKSKSRIRRPLLALLGKFDSRYMNYPAFQLMCSGRFKAKPTRLTCHYITATTPFLRIAPLKMELLNESPYIVVYHDIISAAEAAKLVRISKPNLKRTTVFNYVTNKTEPSNDRTAEGTWLPRSAGRGQDRELVERIERRLVDMTGLSLNDSQKIHVIRYGFGGQYVPHEDFFNVTTSHAQDTGDRLVTAFFYLNDVQQGGETVFPLLNISVTPQRGKVLMWYNMDRNTYDFEASTLHGACPVIYGTKHAMVRWIYERDQLFKLPCYNAPRFRTYE